jgi:hypothetical protein
VTRVRVGGGGVAALCCARLLGSRGAAVVVEPAPPAPSPTLVLSAVTASLIERIFGGRRDLLADAWPIRARGVRWGPGEEAVVAEPALAIRESDLVQRLFTALATSRGRHVVVADPGSAQAHGVATDPGSAQAHGAEERRADDVEWIIAAGGRAHDAHRSRQRFGRRRLIVADCALATPGDASRAMIETTPEGWVFLAPTGRSTGVVQAMVPAPPANPDAQLARMVAQTREVHGRLAAITGAARVFDAAPSLALPLARAGWIAVGDAACSFDPLCGDGVGYAVRGAILACAVIAGSDVGRAERVDHYQARLITALAHHLRACRGYYRGAELDASWASEQRATDEGLATLQGRLRAWPEFQLALRGFDLVPLPARPG